MKPVSNFLFAATLPPLLFLSAAAQAATFTETKLTASDGAGDDEFGRSTGRSHLQRG